MIKSVFISVQSKCIYFKNLDGKYLPSSDLITSFLSAIQSYSKNGVQDDIKSIVMQNTKLYYQIIDETSDLIMVVIADRDAKDVKLKRFIDDVEEALLDNYKIAEITDQSSNPDYFEDFNAALNIIAFKNLGKILI